jgi:tRNA(Met) C34 N-acetyltransferase TmcA
MKNRWQENGFSTVSRSARRNDPSGCNTQLCATSARFAAMICPTICAFTVALVHSTSVSTLRLRFRPIQSAELI